MAVNTIQWAARAAILASGNGLTWLRENLAQLGVRVPVTEGALRALFKNADELARLRSIETGSNYSELLRDELMRSAEFVKSWTQSNGGRFEPRLVDIARDYALPRAWKLAELTAVPARRATPLYMKWASAT